jgi:diketogulonate reductase-like aldo/keto reductase
MPVSITNIETIKNVILLYIYIFTFLIKQFYFFITVIVIDKITTNLLHTLGIKKKNKMDIKTTLRMNNGVEIPVFGLGTYLAVGNEACDAVMFALEHGYRHIDTAAFYGNEAEVGRAVRDSGINREEIFVTTKLWNSDQGYDKALRAFERSMDNFGLDYLDLYLIHWPLSGKRKDSWKALEKIYGEKSVRSIGVSNYTIRHLEEMKTYANVVPVVNQVEFSPFLYQKQLLEYCESNEIYIEAYAPLTRGKRFNDPALILIAGKYGKTPAQILIRWALQVHTIVLPKSSDVNRIIENADVFDFEISDEDMQILNNLNEDYRITWDPSNEL